MNTIEERAKESSKWIPNRTFKEGHRFGYMKGAREQRKIDIDKACEWLEECLPDIEYITNASVRRQNKQQFIESFRKAMEG